MRIRAGVVVCDGERVLLIHRFKRGREYYLIPGGGVEAGESVREAAIRELREETSLTVTLGGELFVCENTNQREHYFRATSYSGEVRLGGEELEKSSEDNVYSLEWIEAERIAGLTFDPPAVSSLLSERLFR